MDLLQSNHKNIYLVGMPGAGKSYWAAQLAAAGKRQCLDLDDIIEVRTGLRISTFFERFGEAAFRKLEQQTLAQVMEVFPKDTVLACGGGTPCFFDNMDRLKAAGIVVYLDASIPCLLERNQAEQQQRPLLRETQLASRLAQLRQQREEVYRQAHIVLPAEELSLDDFRTALQQYL